MGTEQFVLLYVPMTIIPMQRRRENNGIVSDEIHQEYINWAGMNTREMGFKYFENQ